jgi:hypothetical protein
MPNSPSQALTPAEKVLQAAHEHKLTVVRLQDELDALLKIFSHMRQSFENEMLGGLGYKKMGIPPVLVEQAELLTKMITALVSAKIRYDKAAKQMADAMTPEEEAAACMAYVKSMDEQKRNHWLSVLRQWLNDHSKSGYTIATEHAGRA